MSTVDNEKLVPLIVEALRSTPSEPLRREYGPEVNPDLLYEAIDEAMETANIYPGWKAHSDPADPASTLFIEIELQGHTVVSFQVQGHGRPRIPRSVIHAYEQAHGAPEDE